MILRHPQITPALRFDAVRVMLQLTKKELWELLGTNQTSYGKVIKGKKQLPSQWIQYFYEHYKVDPVWILLGKGEVFC